MNAVQVRKNAVKEIRCCRLLRFFQAVVVVVVVVVAPWIGIVALRAVMMNSGGWQGNSPSSIVS